MIKLFRYFLFFPLVFPSFLALAQTDEEYENRLYSIYLQNYQKATTDDEWAEAIKTLSNTSYELKYKDNFWDLSGKHLKNSLYWSKLWTFNPTVENPHRILKGDTIKFDLKVLKAKAKYGVDVSELFPEIDVPPQLYKRGSLMEYEIPSSLPYIKQNIQLEQSSGKIVWSLDPVNIQREAFLPFYLLEDLPLSKGRIVNKEGYGSFSFNGENLIVKMKGSVSPGKRYTVISNRGGFKNLIINLFQGKGYEIRVNGEIKILSYISGTDSLYKAQVTKSANEISSNDMILSGALPRFTLSQKGEYGSSNGLIIGSPNKESGMLSLYSLVYLNKGVNQNVQVGDLYYIKTKSSYSKKYGKRPYNHNQAVVGKLKIIYVDGDVSTGIIVDSKDRIYIGDIFSSSSGALSDLEKSDFHEGQEDYSEEEDSLKSKIPEHSEEVSDEKYLKEVESFEEDASDREKLKELKDDKVEESFEEEDLGEEPLDQENNEDFEEELGLDEEELELELDEEEEELELEEEELEEQEDLGDLENVKEIKDEFQDFEDIEDIEE